MLFRTAAGFSRSLLCSRSIVRMPPKKQAPVEAGKKQLLLGRFFGSADGSKSAPAAQTKLSFAPEAAKKTEESVEAEDNEVELKEVKKNAASTKPTNKETIKEKKKDSDMAMVDFAAEEKATKKRSRSPSPKVKATTKKAAKRSPTPPAKVEEDDEDDEPITKKARRNESGKDSIVAKKAAAQPNPAKEAKAAKTKPVAKATKKEELEESREDVRVASRNRAESFTPETKSEVEEVEEEDEEDEPVVAVKDRKKIQTTLAGSSKDPYPDWKAGEPVPYAALCTTFSLIEMTTKRLIITEHCAKFLRQVARLTPDDLLSTVMLMVNKLAADYAGIELGIGESLIMKAIGEATGRSLAVIKQDQKEIGDLGLVAVKSRSNQPTMFKPKPLTVMGVHKALLDIATMAGNGSQQRKVDGIKKLIASSDTKGGKVDITKDKGGPSEAKFVVRFLEGKLRLGLANSTVLVSLSQAMAFHYFEQKGKGIPSTEQLAEGEEILKTVFSELPSYDVIVPAMIDHGIFELRKHCKLQPGVPLKPMLAKPTKAITEVLDRFENQTFTCEYKYDGERAQIHYVSKDSETMYASSVPNAAKGAEGGLAAIFSRNSEDLSKKYPDILEKLGTWIKEDTKSFVLDCETVAWDVVEKKVLPFQQLMTRKKKDVKSEDVKIKVCVFAFDILFLNGEAVVEKSLRERRKLLHSSFTPVEGEFAFATSMNGREIDEIQAFLEESVKASCEGLMVKMLDGKESSYEPSKRSRNWLKVKKDYLAGVGDSLDLVVLGAYYGRGKRTGAYGAFLLACYNPSSEKHETVCNIGTGFSDEILETLHSQLKEIIIDRPKPFYDHSTTAAHQPDVWFEPRYVWEVKTADLTLSPKYRAACKEGLDNNTEKGVSLRFPRLIRVRDDKKPDEATSSRQIAELYRRQESVSKSKGPAVDDDFEY